MHFNISSKSPPLATWVAVPTTSSSTRAKSIVFPTIPSTGESIMAENLTLQDAAESYIQYLEATSSGAGRKAIVKQFKSALYRVYVTGSNGPSSVGVPKMTHKLLQQARAYCRAQPASKISTLRADFHRGAEILNLSKTSRANYGSCIQRFMDWGRRQGLCQKQPELLAPAMYKRGQGTRQRLKLTQRNGCYQRYRLIEKDTSSKLAEELMRLYSYLTDEFYPSRVTKPVQPSTAKQYLSRTRRVLGFLAYHASPAVPLEELSLESIIPVLEPDELDDLTGKERRRRWNQVCNEVEKRLCDYLKFTQDFSHSFNPGSHADVVSIFKTIFHYLYRDQVRHRSDYKAYPLESLLSRYLDEKLTLKRQAQVARKKTADQSLKFPEPESERTELQILREDVVEVLRLETRPQHQYRTWKSSLAIAKHLMIFLMWAWLVYSPARRQEEQRTLRIWLSCDVKKPPEVPSDGCYWPLPKLRERELDSTQQPCDNYLCRLYRHRGEDYPEGVYILFISSYKTEATGGPQEIILRNAAFQEGNTQITLYDYLDRWLSGHWCKSLGISHTYTWWDENHYGMRGRWASSGRMAVSPLDNHQRLNKHHLLARWGFLFITQRKGEAFSDSSYSKCFSTPAERLIHKKVTPHVLRSVWATWGIEVGLNSAELESLAYAMGHSVETLKRIYARCRPEQKRRPIEQRLDQELLLPASSQPPTTANDSEELAQRLQKLSPEQLKLSLDDL